VDPGALIAAGLEPDGAPGLTLLQAAPAGPARRRILVVDDSITTRTLECSILETAGYDVLSAVDGSDGWRVLQEQGADLVVADVDMPRMDGFALCEAVRASRRFAKLPVVLVTAMESPEHRARGLEAGADAYIGKSSFDQQTLLDAIRQLLE
jgi:two-component system chemotaxis sensor kinase CheA